MTTFIRCSKAQNLYPAAPGTEYQKTFICYGRSDFIAAHESLIRELAEAGFRYIMVGLEAVSDSFLDSYQKHSSQALNIQTIRILHKYGINLVGLFIIDSVLKKRISAICGGLFMHTGSLIREFPSLHPYRGRRSLMNTATGSPRKIMKNGTSCTWWSNRNA